MSNFLNFLKNKSSFNNILTEKVKENGISKMILDNLKDIEEKEVLDKYEQLSNYPDAWQMYYEELEESYEADKIKKHHDFIESLIILNKMTDYDWDEYLYQPVFKINFNLILKHKEIISENVIEVICDGNHLFEDSNYSITYEEMFFRTFKNKIINSGGWRFLKQVESKYSKEFQEEMLKDD